MKRRLTKAAIARINTLSAHKAQRVADRIALALKLAADGSKEFRVKERRCKGCFYLDSGRLVGHAFTVWECAHCDYQGQHHNTGVPRVCDTCSDELRLCVDCGGDIDMQHRNTRPRARLRKAKPAEHARKGGASC